jgi:hypothetical protein
MIMMGPREAIIPKVPQAPPSYSAPPPASAIGNAGQPIGTVVVSNPLIVNYIPLLPPATDPATGRVVAPPPVTAVLGVNQVDTTSRVSPGNPAPIPPVGTFPPQRGVMVKAPAVAPQSQSAGRTLGIFVAVVLVAFLLLGHSFKGVL